MKTWKILARHKWIAGATITESISIISDDTRRFTATIRGWQNWLIYEGKKWDAKKIIQAVKHIRDRIDGNDETVFKKSVRIE
jgi:ribosomal protein S7